MLSVTGLVKTFAAGTRAVDGVSFEVAEGRCYALLGPSGCGKTTTLRCVAGLEAADSGTIAIAGAVVSDPARGVFVPVHRRPIGMVFQSYAIWPHLDVFENVAYPLRVERPRVAKPEIARRVTETLALVGMANLATRPAPLLSGGQQQRVALARALVRRPKLLLLDEPLSNLDARLREQMRGELAELVARAGVTALYVTHDQFEAFALAHRVAVMSEGRIVQEGTPADIYARPRAPFVAAFLGAANLLRGRVEAETGAGEVVVALEGGVHRLALPARAAPGRSVLVALRAEDIAVSLAPGPGLVAGRVARLRFQGGTLECQIALEGGLALRAAVHPATPLVEGAAVWLRIDAQRCVLFEE